MEESREADFATLRLAGAAHSHFRGRDGKIYEITRDLGDLHW